MHAKLRRRKARESRIQRRTQPGAPPGTLVPDFTCPSGTVQVLAYGPDSFVELAPNEMEDLPNLTKTWPVTWINVDGLGDVSVVRELGQLFDLHKLALEDVVSVHQRAKVETYGNCYFVVARMPSVQQRWQTEQVSIFFSDKFVITFQETPGADCLEPVRLRIRTGWGRARAIRPDSLVYAILDAIVDHYFPLVEDCGERLDALEDEIADPSRGTAMQVMGHIHEIKRDLLTVRRIIWPMRDAVNTLLRDSTPLICDETKVYLRDVHDHTIQIIDLVESYRDVASGVAEVHLAEVSQRTNEIMKVLTIMSSIFIPLTFIAGVYGMNFDRDAGPWSMPELYWAHGYPAVMGFMALVAGGMLVYFWRKGWLGGKKEP